MSSVAEHDAEARAILIANDRGGYSIPTNGLYPYQWNWDSAFAAFGFAQFNIDRAWTELETLVSGQWRDGMIPHILFHKPDPGYFPGPEVWGGTGPLPSSGISQPPVAATLARRIHEMDPASGAGRLRALYPRFLEWHRWFMEWRLDNGTVCVTHPWEAGRDNSPDWDGPMARIDPGELPPYERRDTGHVDPSMRPTRSEYDRYLWLVLQGRDCGWDQAELLEINPFRVADPTMTFTLLRACRDLEWIGRELGFDTSDLPGWIDTLEKGAATLWNPDLGSYDSRDVRNGGFAGCISSASFLCWYAGVPPRGMAEQYRRIVERVNFGVPSYDPDGAGFERKRYWRGPVWAIMNMMIGNGLIEAGLPEGDDLRAATAELILESGFSEYFDPLDGTSAGGKSFTWTAAVWLGWASPSARRE